ncbi:alpha/beta fold hydrolase [Micromonospora profundi]|uniref:alpha/beta fold hydrolase n=1 Tax=Micromonospora profundi TaxID=1420889 RepID=UPI0036B4A284
MSDQFQHEPSVVVPGWWDRRIGVAAAVAAAGLYGLIAAWATPRGPVTTLNALLAIGAGLLVGVFAGLVMRSRWAMLLAPITFVAVFELARIATVGPLVDGLNLGSTYGIVAFVLGRGLHGVLTVLPMIIGVSLGVAAARGLDRGTQIRTGRASVGRWARAAVAGLAVLGLIALSVAVLRPAQTDAIVSADGEPMPGSVAELTRVPAGGHDLAVMIRGTSVDRPVLLYLAGGPGGSDIGAMRKHGQDLEKAFVVVTFDQRGTGKSYDNLDPTATLTLDAAVADVIDVTDYLRERFGQDKIYLVGNSWGSILGVLAAQRHPELFHAFVGAGQMVSPRETDQIFYTDTLAWARSTGNTQLERQLVASGPPPYTTMLDYEPALTYEHQVYPYDDTLVAESSNGFSDNLFVAEYSLMEQLHGLAGFLDVFTVLYPQLQEIDLRTQVTQLQVPVYLVQGRHEARGRAEPAQQWFQLIDAPTKKMVIFELSGHRTLFQQPNLFYQLMTTTVLGRT